MAFTVVPNITNIVVEADPTVVDAREVVSLVLNVDGTDVFYTQAEIDGFLLNKQDVNSYIDGGEFL